MFQDRVGDVARSARTWGYRNRNIYPLRAALVAASRTSMKTSCGPLLGSGHLP